MYIIKSKVTPELYIGTTSNLVRRLEEHNAGKSKATKRYMPWFFVYIEGYFLKEDALNREHNLKYFGKVYAQLKRRIKNSLQSAEKVRG
jgi:putative endonuclease